MTQQPKGCTKHKELSVVKTGSSFLLKIQYKVPNKYAKRRTYCHIFIEMEVFYMLYVENLLPLGIDFIIYLMQ